MNSAFISLVLPGLSLFGVAVTAVVLISLWTKRDRWIIRGTVVTVFLFGALAAFAYYGDDLEEIARARMQKEGKSVEPSPDISEPLAETGDRDDAYPAEVDMETAARPEDDGGDELVPVPGAPVTVSPTERDDSSDRRRIVRTLPQDRTRADAAPERDTRPAARVTAPERDTRTTRETSPPPVRAPEPTLAPPPAPEPARAPPPIPVRPSTPAPAPTPSPAPAGSGTLVVTIKGPIVETSQQPAGSPHIMVLIDGKKMQTKGPTRQTEKRQDDDPAGPVLAVTYFWESVTFTFTGLEPGYHVIQIDTSLDAPASHRSFMAGAGQTQNDYNGSVEVVSGKTTVIEFGAKNWMSGQLIRIK